MVDSDKPILDYRSPTVPSSELEYVAFRGKRKRAAKWPIVLLALFALLLFIMNLMHAG